MNHAIRRLVPAIPTVMLAALGAASLSARQGDQDDVRLKAAMKKEAVDGELRAAMAQYQNLAKSANRAVAAQALVRLGQCYEKLGDAETGRARRAYEQIVARFADQTEPATQARARLAALGGKASPDRPTLARVGRGFVRPSPDGGLLLGWTGKKLSVRNVQTGQTRLIPLEFDDVAVSHDNRQLAYVRFLSGAYELHVIGTDGSGERTVWRASSRSDYLGEMEWFPDGKRIMGILYADKDARPVVISTRDGSLAALREGLSSAEAHLSPDGRSALYRKRIGDDARGDELWLLGIDAGTESLLFRGQSRIEGVLWTPDGGSVVFLSDRRMPGASFDMWSLPLPTGNEVATPVLLKTDLGQFYTQGGHVRPAVFALGPITPSGALYFKRLSQTFEWLQLMSVRFDAESGTVNLERMLGRTCESPPAAEKPSRSGFRSRQTHRRSSRARSVHCV